MSTNRLRYTPLNSLDLVLGIFNRDHEFESLLTLDSDKPNELDKLIGFRFKREDGSHINYFKTVLDVEEKINYRATLSTWLKRYFELLRLGKLNANDITILPLRLIDKKHSQLNTLVFRFNSSGCLQVHIIDPRSTSKITSSNYPLMDNVVKPIMDACSENRIPSDIRKLKMGHVDTDDENHDGFNHVNYVDMIGQLPAQCIESPDFQTLLNLADPDRRYDDDRNYWKRMNETLNMSRKSQDEGKFHGMGSMYSAETYEELRRRKPKTSRLGTIDQSLKIVGSYLERTPSFAFLFGHTRIFTLNSLMQIADAIKKGNDTDTTKEIKIAQLLYQTYCSIKDTRSKLRDRHLALALATFLDCKTEYYAIRNRCTAGHYTVPDMKSLFRNRIALLRIKHSYSVDDTADLNKMQKKLNTISKNDSSIFYKFKLFRRDINLIREKAIGSIRKTLGIEESPESLKKENEIRVKKGKQAI